MQDPENHQLRQRELINELDEARKELEQGSRKRKWNLFGRNKDPAKKKEWETYLAPAPAGDAAASAPATQSSAVLFDIDAIRAEIENAEKEERAAAALATGLEGLRVAPAASPAPSRAKSYDDRAPAAAAAAHASSARSSCDRAAGGGHGPAAAAYGAGKNVWADDDDEYDEFAGGGGGMQMTFA